MNAGADVTLYLPVNQVILTGKATDSDGTIATILWEKQSGPAATLANASTLALTASGLAQGAYVFRLTVTDNSGGTKFDDVNVQVLQANQSPTANAGTDKTITLPTNTVILSGSGTDPDDGIASYQWKTVSGGAATLTNANTPTLTVKGLVQGTYVFGLTVTDNSGATGYDEVTVIVDTDPTNTPPVVSAGGDIKHNPAHKFGNTHRNRHRQRQHCQCAVVAQRRPHTHPGRNQYAYTVCNEHDSRCIHVYPASHRRPRAANLRRCNSNRVTQPP